MQGSKRWGKGSLSLSSCIMKRPKRAEGQNSQPHRLRANYERGVGAAKKKGGKDLSEKDLTDVTVPLKDYSQKWTLKV